MAAPQEDLKSRYEAIMAKVDRAAKDRAVSLIAVSKTHSPDAVEALYKLGHRDFGESYVQELSAKAEELEKRGCTNIRWHFIGHLQTNKVKQLVPHVYAVHSVDSEKLARELAKRWTAAGRAGRLPVFIEVNIDQEATKSGLTPGEVPMIANAVSAIPELELLGLMCIPEADRSEPETRTSFKKLTDLEATLRPLSRGDLSMGMSEDFEIAIQEGSTHVRVGTALFGSRPKKA